MTFRRVATHKSDRQSVGTSSSQATGAAISRRLFLGGTGAVALTGGLTACAVGAEKASPKAHGGVTDVTLVYGVPTMDVTSAWFADIPQELKYYQDENLNVQVQAVAGGSASIGAVVAGKAEFATQSSPVIFTSVDKGIKLKGFMCEIPGDFTGIAVLESSGVQSVDQLKEWLRGKTIGTNAIGGNPDIETRAVVTRLGLVPDKDVKFLAVGAAVPALNALQKGRVQALGLWAMVFADFTSEGAKLKIFQPPPIPDLGFQHVTVASDETMKNRPDVVAGFSRAVAKSLVFMSAVDPKELVKLHYRRHPATKPQGLSETEAIDKGVALIASVKPYMDLQARVSGSTLLGDATDDQITGLGNLLLHSKVIKSLDSPDAYFNRDFLKKANAFDKQAVITAAKNFKA